MSPLSGSSKVASRRIKVDLPEPLGPSTPKISAPPTVKETWSTATMILFDPLGFNRGLLLPPNKGGRFQKVTPGLPNFLYASLTYTAVDMIHTPIKFKAEKEASYWTHPWLAKAKRQGKKKH